MKTDPNQAGKNPTGGFSLLELLAVIAIMAVVAAIAVPPVITTVRGFKLRSAAADMEGVIQATRMRAVRDDGVYSMVAVAVGNATVYCVSPAGAINCLAGEQQFAVPADVQIIGEGAAPATVPVTANPTYYQDAADPVTYNARGLPCLYFNNACSTLPQNNTPLPGSQVGYVYYLSVQPTRGPAIYRAVTVTPAGRLKVLSYSSGRWQ